jgi:hypothetical protein
MGTLIRVNPGNPSINVHTAEAGSLNDATLLLSDDKTTSYALGKGTSSFILCLPVTDILNEFSFFSYDAAGSVTIQTSPVDLAFDSPRWRTASSTLPFSSGEACSVALNFAEARYVKISLDCKQAGRVTSFSVFGARTLTDFGTRERRQNTTTRVEERKRLSQPVNYDYADAYTGSKVRYVSSAGSNSPASTMVDDNPRTYYPFARTDSSPTVIVEMMQPERIRRVSALLKAPPGKVEVYVMSSLPFQDTSLSANEAVLGIPLPADFYAKHRPTSVTSVLQDGRAMLDFEMTSGRYILFRFVPVTPIPTKTARTSPSVSLNFAAAAETDEPLVRLYEISAFGDNPNVEFYPYGVSQPAGTNLPPPPVNPDPPIIVPQKPISP